MKRGFFWIISCLVLLGMTPTVITAQAQEVQITVSDCDTTRDTGKLIVYTDAYGESTGTNYWGAEAIVDSDNRVTALVGGNAEIPKGGFVVSGHDDDSEGGSRMKAWIHENITMGDYVYFNRRTMTLTVSDAPLAQSDSPFFSFEHVADGMNATRDENHLVVYTPRYGASTNTNEYGYEIVVEDGVVTDLGGNDSAIPTNGFVLSAHGDTAKSMRAKVIKGMTVTYDPDTLNVMFSYSAEGLQKAVTHAIEDTQTAIEEAKKSFVFADYDAAQTALDSYEEAFRTAWNTYQQAGGDTAFADECDRLTAAIGTVKNALCDSYPVQYRGVWIRPAEKSAAAVEETVKELYEAGINLVCVEGWFENGVIMDVPEDSLFAHHPSFSYDVLHAYIDACHRYGMECHLWMPIMNIGSTVDSGYEERTVPGKRPEWLSLNNNGKPDNKSGFMMIDPANEEARAYLLSFYEYLVTTYDIDGFEMDYIRYYASDGNVDFGYTEAAFEGFEEAYGYGVTPEYDEDAAYWKDWCAYRRDCITDWVREIRDMIDRKAPDVLLGADVAFPFEHALNSVYQDFPTWLSEGLLDILHPMAYGDGYGDEIRKAVTLAGDRCMVVTGLGAHMDILGAVELERQAREDNTYGAYGECYFEASTYLADQASATAKQSVYRNAALPPFLDADASICRMLDYMTERIDAVVVPLGGMSASEAETVKAAVTAAKETVADGRVSPQALTALRGAIATVANDTAKQVLRDDLSRAERITCVSHQLNRGELTSEESSVPETAFPYGVVIAVAAAIAAVVAVVVIVAMEKAQKKAT